MYKGWRIYAYNRKISKTEELTIVEKLRTWFNSEDWSFYENSHTIAIFYGPNQQKINVSFQEVKYELDTYYIVLESPFFGYKTRDERLHQVLCEKIIQKIPWRKQGFLLEDNTQKPIPGTTMTRTK